MHHAPAISYIVQREPSEGLVWLGVLTLALLAGLLWVHEVKQPGWSLAVFSGLSLLCLGWGVWSWRYAGCGTLIWNGEAWTWRDAQGERPVVPHVRLDFQSIMLLELVTGSHRSIWLWLVQRPVDWNWIALRRALHGLGVRASDTGAPARDDERTA